MTRPKAFVVLAVLLLVALVVLRTTATDGRRVPDRTTAALLDAGALETVVALEYPPGNVTVATNGRVFFTLHPAASPPFQLAELVNGQVVPYPNRDYQQASARLAHFDSILSIRVDQQNRLWVLDYARYGFGQPRILAFDLTTNQLVHEHAFASTVAGFGSMLNDFQVDPQGRLIYIADTSPIFQRPGLIVYDTINKHARRVLSEHPAVSADDVIIQAPGRDMIAFGILPLRLGIDSIGLDPQGNWLYFGPMSGDRLYRIRAPHLSNRFISNAQLDVLVEDYAMKPISDGIATDADGGVYLTDIENSAILRLSADKTLQTVIKDPRLRWPDGLSWGPDDWLYVTSSSLQTVLFSTTATMKQHAPYFIYRFRPTSG